MAKQGYAAVTYRNVAAEAGVTAGLVQYYFARLDDLLLDDDRTAGPPRTSTGCSTGSRPGPINRSGWCGTGAATSSRPCCRRSSWLWPHHRKALQVGIREVTERLRRAQLAALEARAGGPLRPGRPQV